MNDTLILPRTTSLMGLDKLSGTGVTTDKCERGGILKRLFFNASVLDCLKMQLLFQPTASLPARLFFNASVLDCLKMQLLFQPTASLGIGIGIDCGSNDALHPF